MRKFAEVLTGTNIVRHVFDWELDVNPEFDPSVLYAIEVTNLDPLPDYGWTYLDGVFSPPV